MKFKQAEIITIDREQINFADYNPRKIHPEEKKKLKRSIREFNLVETPVWNKRTGNLISGHQRIAICDEESKNGNYKLNVSVVDLSEKDEIRLNVILNNPDVQGKFDNDMLYNILEDFKDIDPVGDLGFDKASIEFMFDGINFENSEFFKTDEHKKVLDEVKKIENSDKLREYKKQTREKLKDGQELTRHIEKEDYSVIFVFNSNRDKRDFIKKIGAKESEKFFSYKKLYDILKEEYR